MEELAAQLRAANEGIAREQAARQRLEREHEQAVVKLRMERDAAKKAAVGHQREERLDKMKEEQKRIFLNHEAEVRSARAAACRRRARPRCRSPSSSL